jgi:hypothetical protein
VISQPDAALVHGRAGRADGSRRAVGLAAEGRGEKLPPLTARPRVNPGRLRRVALAALSLSTARARPRSSRPGPSGPARRRCALELGRRPRVLLRAQPPVPAAGRRRLHIGEKLRTESPLVKAALSRQGRYQIAAGNMQVKEVRLPDATDRLVICYNPDAAERDAAIRAGLIAKLEEMIAGTDKLTATKRAELRGKISTMPGLNRFLRVTPGGLLRTDKAKAEENLDGKYLLRCAGPQLSGEDIAVGYKQLLEVERGWRDMKSVLDLRPVCHRLEERIRAHVLLCWLALLLVRVAENKAGQTWPVMRRELGRIHLGTFAGPAGTFSPGPPGPSGSAPNCPRPPGTCWPGSASTRRARSTSWARVPDPGPAPSSRPGLETRPAARLSEMQPRTFPKMRNLSQGRFP